jgi:hypothetical protein
MDLQGVIILVVALLVVIGITFFLIYGLNPMIRSSIKASGIPAKAKILEQRLGRMAVYSGDEYSNTVSSQQVILKLQVYPPNGAPYIAEDKFMAKALDLMRLTAGCELTVYIAKGNPQKVVCDPKTVSASLSAPVGARAGMAMADLASQTTWNSVPDLNQVMDALKAHGVQGVPPVMPGMPPAVPGYPQNIPGYPPSIPGAQEDTKAKMENLKAMLESGLITQQEFDAKKKDLLDRM